MDPRSILVLPNGLLNLDTGQLEDSDPNLFSMNLMSTRFDPNAEYDLWLKFLEQLWPDDAESIEALQRWFGYVLSPNCWLQKIMLMIGPKRAGKGIITRISRKLVGKKFCCSPTLGSLSHNFGLQSMIGTKLATINDARFTGRNDQSTVVERLLSISGQDSQHIDRKCIKSVERELDAKMMIISNELPALRDGSGALFSRFIILQLTNSFAENPDVHLEKKLTKQLSGILNWSLEGWRKLNEEEEIVQPSSSDTLLQIAEELGSPIGKFISDVCIVDDKHIKGDLQTPCRVHKDILYGAYKQHCERHGILKPVTVAILGRELKSAAPKIESKRFTLDTSGKREQFYLGIKLNDEWCS